MTRKVYRFLAGRLRHGEVRDRIYRILGITSLLIAIGGSVILVAAVMMRMHVLVVALSGILSMALAFYLFVKLWPVDETDEVVDRRIERVRKAIQAKKAPPAMSPEEYRRQRQKAQQLIARKAAPAIAKAIQGILLQADLDERARR
jgi:4-amino-4-deoxy-L-arabinose transferase-like glycosyltransferase